MNQNPAGNSTLTIAPGRVPDGLLMIWTTSEFGCWKRILSQHALHHGLLELGFLNGFGTDLPREPKGEKFMPSPFFIQSKLGNLVIDIQGSSTKPGTFLDAFTKKIDCHSEVEGDIAEQRCSLSGHACANAA